MCISGGCGYWYRIATEKLQKFSLHDLVTGEYYISYSNARSVLGQVLRVPKQHHNKIIDELVGAGFVVRLNKRTLRVVVEE
jgi:hypothetical protein